MLEGLEWSQAADVWSIGCVIYEVLTREHLLYPCEDMRERLAAIDRIMGPFPHDFSLAAESKHKGLFNPSAGGRILFPSPSYDIEDAEVCAAILHINSRHPLWVSRI